MPKVSVIIPVYGVEKYIERCARSLFEQTLDDIEYLFIDDCTPDKSIEILKNVLEEYPHRKNQIIIHRMEKNSGQAAVRKWGMLNATGDYVIHCDSDDWVDVTMYEKMYNKAIEEDADVVVCDFYRSDSVTDVGTRVLGIPKNCKDHFKDLLCHKLQPAVWNKLVRRDLYDKIYFYPTYNMGEDFALLVQIFNNCKKIMHLKQPLYYYFTNSESITGLNSYDNVSKRVIQLKENVLLVQKYLSGQGLDIKYKDEITNLKIFTKGEALQCSHDEKWLHLWREVFPEIRLIDVLLDSNTSIKGKIAYLLVMIGLYRK